MIFVPLELRSFRIISIAFLVTRLSQHGLSRLGETPSYFHGNRQKIIGGAEDNGLKTDKVLPIATPASSDTRPKVEALDLANDDPTLLATSMKHNVAITPLDSDKKNMIRVSIQMLSK